MPIKSVPSQHITIKASSPRNPSPYQLKLRPLQCPTPSQVKPSPPVVRLLLQSPEPLSHMVRPHRSGPLLGGIEQPLRTLPLLHHPATAVIVAPALQLVQVLFPFDLERFFRQRLHHLEGQEAQYVNDVVVGLAVRHDTEPRPLAEPFPFAEREGRLSAVAEVHVLVLGHVFRPLVGQFEPLQRRVVHFFFVFVFFIFAIGDLFGVEALDVPGEKDLVAFVFLRCVADDGSTCRATCGIAEGVVGT